MLDSPLGKLYPQIVDDEIVEDEYKHLSIDELIDLLRVPPPEGIDGDFDTNAMPIYTGIAFAILQRGTPGRKAIWEETKDTHPTALRAILTVLWEDPGQQTRVRKRLEKLLDSEDPIEIVIALEGFSYCSDYKARARVLKFADHPNPNVRTRALNYMTGLFPAEALPLVVEALDDEDPLVRTAAIYDIAGLSVLDVMPRAHEAVERMRKDRDPGVRFVAGRILDHFYEPTDYGTDLLNEGLSELQYRRGKTRPIWKDVERAEKRDDFESQIPLLAALIIADADDERVRSKIRALLFDEDGILSPSIEPIHLIDAIYMLGIIGDWKAQDQILELRSSEDLEIADAAYWYERFLNPAQAVETNLGLLSSPDSFLRTTAIERLQDIWIAEVDLDVRARIASLQDDPDEDLRAQSETVLQPSWQGRLKVFNLIAGLK